MSKSMPCPLCDIYYNPGVHNSECPHLSLPSKEENKDEKVNHPTHYGGDTTYEVIKVLKAWFIRDEYIGFLKGNSIKYMVRHRLKNGDEDLKKAKWYQDELDRFLKEDQKP